jgi:hypothetical protein
MESAKAQNKQHPLSVAIGRVEIGLGLLLFVYGTLSPMVGRFYPSLEPDILYGLWPLFLIFGGVALVVSGAGFFKGGRWQLLMHLPLVGWLVMMWLTFR